MFDITQNKELADIINNALNDGKILEIKNEARPNEPPNIVIVEITRQVRTKKARKF